MKSIRVPGYIDENNQLVLDESLDVIKPQKVELDIWFLDDDEEDEDYPSTKEEILAGFRESLGDLLAGKTTPVKGMWDNLRIKATGEIDPEGRLILDRPLTDPKSQDVDVVIWFLKTRISGENVEIENSEAYNRDSIASVR
jgi:hypothetical protein